MPTRILTRICKRCNATTKDPSGLCSRHAAVISEQERQRGSAAKRGYDRHWRKVRKLKLAQDPFCECQICIVDDCKIRGKRIATMVHHIKPISSHPDLRLALDNLMSVDTDCHAKIESVINGKKST